LNEHALNWRCAESQGTASGRYGCNSGARDWLD
jgi:hypothetical protein